MKLSWQRNVAFVLFLLHMTRNTRNQHVQIRDTIFECSSSSCDKVTSGRTIEQREVAEGAIESIGAESVGARGDKGDEWVSACGEGATWDDRLTAALLARRRAQGLRADAFLLAASARGGYVGGLREQRRLLRLQRLLHAQGLRSAAGGQKEWLRLLHSPIGQRSLALLPCGSRGARLLREGPLGQVAQLAQVALKPGALLLPLPPFAARRLLEHAQLRFDSALLVVSRRRRGAQAQLRLLEAWRAGEGRPLDMRWLEEGLEETLESRFQRPRRRLRARADLRGVTFRAVSGYWALSGNELVSGERFLMNFFSDVWKAIEDTFGYSTVWNSKEYLDFGHLSPNGSWSGIMGELQRREADVAACDMSMGNSRKDYVDFTHPAHYMRLIALIRRPKRGLRWTDFLHPFRGSLWAAVAVAALLLSLALAAVVFVGARAGGGGGPVAPRDSWLFVAAAFCQQGQRVPRAWSGRVLCVCAHLVALVLAAAHSGSLISALSAGEHRLPFNSLKEALDDPSTVFFDKTTDDTNLHSGKLWELVKKNAPVDHFSSVATTLKNLCENDRHIAIIEDGMLLLISDKVPCDLVELPSSRIIDPLSMAFPKGSPYCEIFSYYIRRMRRVGVLMCLVHRHWPRSSPPEYTLQPSVRLGDVAPLFAALAAGALLSLLILTIERRFPPGTVMSRYLVATDKYGVK